MRAEGLWFYQVRRTDHSTGKSQPSQTLATCNQGMLGNGKPFWRLLSWYGWSLFGEVTLWILTGWQGCGGCSGGGGHGGGGWKGDVGAGGGSDGVEGSDGERSGGGGVDNGRFNDAAVVFGHLIYHVHGDGGGHEDADSGDHLCRGAQQVQCLTVVVDLRLN